MTRIETARGVEMGVTSSVELRDLTAIAVETMDVFAEFYSKEYALQLVNRLEKNDLDTIKCVESRVVSVFCVGCVNFSVFGTSSSVND